MMAVLSVSTLASLDSTAQIRLQVNVPAPVVTVPAPVIAVPAPVVTVPAPAVTVEVPDSYVWDGTEYVGVVGSSFFYLGPGNVWLALDAPRLARFHDWERGHADWRTHAIRNSLYRRDAKGHEVPFHDNHDVRDSHDAHEVHGDDHGRSDHDHH